MHSHREQLARLSQVYLLGTENGQSGFLRHVGPAISGPEYLQSTDLSVLSTVKKLSGGLRYGFPELFGLRLRVFELENEKRGSKVYGEAAEDLALDSSQSR